MEIVTCPKCKMRVLPKQNGTCPSCQAYLPSEKTHIIKTAYRTAKLNGHSLKRETHKSFKRRRTHETIPEFLKGLFGLTKPKHNELSTYLTALTCVILFFIHPDFRLYLSEIIDSTAHLDNLLEIIAFFIMGFIALLGFLLSIIHVFTTREKSSFERYCMGAFAIGANALASIQAGLDEINSGGSLLVIFPIWNIIMGFIMFFEIRYRYFEVADENVSFLQVSGASLILLVLFAITTFAFQLTWAMKFSICLFYSSLIYFLIS